MCGTVVWSTQRVERRVSALEHAQKQRDKRTAAQLAELRARLAANQHHDSPSTPAKRKARVINPASQLYQQEFSAVWRSAHRDKAETKCFAPAAARGGEMESSPHFHVTVDAEGKVTAAKGEPRATMGDLYACVAKVIVNMRLKATGVERSAMVQAERAPASP